MPDRYTEAQKKCIYRYREKKDTISIQSEKGTRDVIRKHVESTGESMSAFINRAIMETIENDNRKKSKVNIDT